MVDFKDFSKIVTKSSSETIEEFLKTSQNLKISEIKEPIIFEDVSGPSVEVKNEKLKYQCVLQYKNTDNTDVLNLLKEKYPFLIEDELPNVDLLDLFGEFLNILCGKINKGLEKSVEGDLNIEIPYFEYGIDTESSQIGSIQCSLDDLELQIHYLLRN